ncbi:MAG TPA: iron-containing alcohol dehydrogenase [Ktedonobacteraceae bacterium]|nr:iron-containing alcohol dehydrogenase [Ktedonobacteraceae bacterium]
MRTIPWQVGETAIPYLIGNDCLPEIAHYLVALDTDKILIVADDKIKDLYGLQLQNLLHGRVEVEIVGVTSEEDGKTLATLERLLTYALSCQLTRRSLVVSMGGGIVGNISGTLAALLFRGIRLVHIPTTLLAMHDSVTSMKQAINHNGIKNIVGTYYLPTAILTDVAVLHTLPQEHIRSALFELVKNALIFGGTYFSRLQALLPRWECIDTELWIEFVKLGIEAKYDVLKDDPKEAYQGIMLEYGHTIGHALNVAYNEALSHGEAVAWGMVCAAEIALRLGFLVPTAYAQHHELLHYLGDLVLPAEKPDEQFVVEKLLFDNKRGYITGLKDHVSMILLRDLGQPHGTLEEHYLTSVPLELIRETLLQFALVDPAPVDHTTILPVQAH